MGIFPKCGKNKHDWNHHLDNHCRAKWPLKTFRRCCIERQQGASLKFLFLSYGLENDIRTHPPLIASKWSLNNRWSWKNGSNIELYPSSLQRRLNLNRLKHSYLPKFYRIDFHSNSGTCFFQQLPIFSPMKSDLSPHHITVRSKTQGFDWQWLQRRPNPSSWKLKVDCLTWQCTALTGCCCCCCCCRWCCYYCWWCSWMIAKNEKKAHTASMQSWNP